LEITERAEGGNAYLRTVNINASGLVELEVPSHGPIARTMREVMSVVLLVMRANEDSEPRARAVLFNTKVAFSTNMASWIDVYKLWGLLSPQDRDEHGSQLTSRPDTNNASFDGIGHNS